MWNIQKALPADLTRWPRGFITALLALMLLASCAVKPQIRAVISNKQLSTSGVAIERAGSTFLAKEGTELKTGDIIKTGVGQEAVLLLENGAVEVTLFESSQITISSIILTIGDLAVKVKRKLKEVFQVETEFGNAASESTIYYVSVKQDRDIRVVGLEGSVRYYPPDNSPSVALAARDEASWDGQRVIESTLGQQQYNSLLRRINSVERAHKKGSATYVMPNVMGLPLTDAKVLLRNEGFRKVETQPVLSAEKLATVVRTTPASGKLASSSLAVVISYAEKATTMPNVVGLYEAQALNTLNRTSLAAGVITRKMTGAFKVGQVITQSTSAGSAIAAGSKVNLTIEAESVRVPNVQGMRRDIAIRTLEKYGLTVGTVDVEYGLNTRGDSVSYQSVYPDKRVLPGTAVNLRVDEVGVYIPNLIGLHTSKAVGALRGISLRVIYAGTRVGYVSNQSIAGGSVVKAGSQLVLEVEKPRVQ